MKQGEALPTLSFTTTHNQNASFSDYKGHWLIVYFYPKDKTPGCTLEGENFRDAAPAFEALNAVILGVSRDTLTCHHQFKSAYHFPFELIADTDETLCQLFDVIKTKNRYGKMVRGIERSTFLIDPNGIVQKIWRNVTVNGHVQAVLSSLEALQNTV